MKQVERYETVIVGGGQAGLSVGYHLKKQGRSFVILDASERIGDSWRKRWDSLRLYSPAFRDGLPGMPFPAPTHRIPDEGRDGRLPRGVRDALRAPGAQRRGGRGADEGGRPLRRDRRRPALRGRQRRRRHRRLPEAVHARVRGRARPEHHPASLQRLPQPVAAAGRAGARRRREPLGLGHRLRGIGVTRRRSLRAPTPGRFRCRSRAGADASDSACSCSSARTSSTSTRRWAERCARTSGTAAGRCSATARRSCSRAGVERVLARTVGVERGLPVLDDGRVLDVRNVVWCTGFRPDFSWIRVPVRDRRRRLSGAVPRRRRLVTRPLLRGAAVPALVRVDARRR